MVGLAMSTIPNVRRTTAEGLVVDAVTIEEAGTRLPDGLARLADVADADGVRNMRILVDRWAEGGFTRPGERLLVARSSDGDLVAVGGITECPHVAGALRMRRWFVDPRWRRRGLARKMADDLIAGAWSHTDTITCNAQASAAAPPFWESLGFEPVDTIPGITHLRRRGS